MLELFHKWKGVMTSMGKKIQRQEPDGFSSSTTGNGSQSPSPEEETGAQSQTNRAAATGPRTEHGKRTSSQNAVKFGIFSRATLLKGESRSDYQSLLEGLREALHPEGRLEELLVEKLASISWRYNRFLVAEGAEIRKGIEFPEPISRGSKAGIPMEIFAQSSPLISRVNGTEAFARCLGLLAELRSRINDNGFDDELDGVVLQTIYGEPSGLYAPQTLFDEYTAWASTARMTEEERAREGCATPDECKQCVLDAFDAEIERLKKDQADRESTVCNRRKIEILRLGIPDSRVLDRLLRYEASLERDFDRTLTQLERLQRIRKGQPPPPQLDINIS
jgi:hypothetical protein